MVKCTLCKSPGTNKSTCPLNPDAAAPNPLRHPLAIATARQAPAPAPVRVRAPARQRSPSPVQEPPAPSPIPDPAPVRARARMRAVPVRAAPVREPEPAPQARVRAPARPARAPAPELDIINLPRPRVRAPALEPPPRAARNPTFVAAPPRAATREPVKGLAKAPSPLRVAPRVYSNPAHSVHPVHPGYPDIDTEIDMIAKRSGARPSPSERDYTQAKAPLLPRGHVGINTKAWGTRKPNTKEERQQLLDKCGEKCFLVPEGLKYPVCPKGSCEYDCDGIRAARNITYLVHNKTSNSDEARERALVARDKAQRLGVEHCGWS